MFAEVAVPVHVRQTFTYHLTDDLASRAHVGCRVIVPFGRKLLTGFIVALAEQIDHEPSNLKEVEQLIDETPIVSPEILELTRWMADYYFAPWGECLRAALPAGSMSTAEQVLVITQAGREFLSSPAAQGKPSTKTIALGVISKSGTITARELDHQMSKSGAASPTIASLIRRLGRTGFIEISQRVGEGRLRPKLQNVVSLLDPSAAGVSEPPLDPAEAPVSLQDGGALAPEPTPSRKPGRKARSARSKGPERTTTLTSQQQRVLDTLSARPDAVPLSELLETAGVSVSSVRSLEKLGRLQVTARELRRDPLAHVTSRTDLDLVYLTPEQQAALEQITAKLEDRKYATFLLHGVTGSGKTEIYIQAMRHSLLQGASALMLIPEISLTPVFSRRLRAEFGDAVAILHSSLSEGERIDEWRRIKSGEARVVIGTRSAVFAPLANLGIVIVDEEHETSYKQDETPRYNGRDTAIVRASSAGAVVVLGSATPSLESFHNAHTGKYTYIRLESRFGNRGLAHVQAVDMRQVFKRHGKQQTFSDELKEAIAQTHSRREQSMILLNRRGFSSFLVCRSCGVAIHCPNCDVTLTYHRYNASLQCHYCNYIRPVPDRCPACEGPYVHYVGEGTEQIQAKLRQLYPAMNIARLDRDTTRRRGSYEHILMEFASGSIDMLVGTQMIAKGHDFHNVTLVGVISVDTGLSLPDFRSAERTFQLLTQVAGRAGRGARPGKVIIQTYYPEHYSIVCAGSQDYEGFYQREIQFRRAMHYPPFTALINLLIHDKDHDRANTTSAFVARQLREAARDSSLRVLGPAVAPISRLKGEHRFQILIKATSRRTAREALDSAMDKVTAAGHNERSIAVEIDPINLM
jgi:primosomal protein N' (replication factor Y)